MEETRIIKRVGYYTTQQAKPEDCKQCHKAIWGTIIVDDICLDCLIKVRSQLEMRDKPAYKLERPKIENYLLEGTTSVMVNNMFMGL